MEHLWHKIVDIKKEIELKFGHIENTFLLFIKDHHKWYLLAREHK